MNTIYRNALEENLDTSVFEDKELAIKASAYSAYCTLKNFVETDSGDVEDWEFFGENSNTIKEYTEQIIDALGGKYVKEYKLKGNR